MSQGPQSPLPLTHPPRCQPRLPPMPRHQPPESPTRIIFPRPTLSVRTKVWSSRKDGILCRFTENSVVAMKKTAPVGSMVKGPVPFELHHPIMAIASKVI
eukprot:GHVN01040230.1.p1 GENE.GHVN01040230.1~~GHVN01040230.1.p1  ORF type:complete len:100 (+),score=13.77 GHVN01040230.1:66-365(+)